MNLCFLALLFLACIAPLCLALADEDDANLYDAGLRGPAERRHRAHIAHGVVTSLAAVVLFPTGAILLRLFKAPRAVRIHWIFQLSSLFVLLWGFGLGIWVAYLHDQSWNKTHEKVGTVIVAMYCLQPMIGLYTHLRFRATNANPNKSGPRFINGKPKPTGSNYLHIWFGRALLIAGIVNGGLGLRLAADSAKGQKQIYIMFPVITAMVYGFALFVWFTETQIQAKKDAAELRARQARLSVASRTADSRAGQNRLTTISEDIPLQTIEG